MSIWRRACGWVGLTLAMSILGYAVGGCGTAPVDDNEGGLDECTDGIDNDNDGATDCADSGCTVSACMDQTSF